MLLVINSLFFFYKICFMVLRSCLPMLQRHFARFVSVRFYQELEEYQISSILWSIKERHCFRMLIIEVNLYERRLG